ncbi:hypothetical protein RF11_04088 [Thelohanellus kitauei]|uniref:Tc1-like transposase DDE domain-containing protein n=1 Tax=Thelohanellus kitauei TaxID=669202 RepID=A0A0C2MZD4_THEKT|nr:hypothetical protein RF11_04088 [Thelohanellus kitauei]
MDNIINTEDLQIQPTVEIANSIIASEPTIKYNEINEDRRKRIRAAHQPGNSILTIYSYENLPRSTISSILNKFQRGKYREQKTRGGRNPYRMTPDIKQCIRYLLVGDCTISLRMISIKIYEKYSTQFGKTTIIDCLDDIHLSIKCAASILEKRNDPNTILIRKTYSEKFIIIEEQFPSQNVIFLDEVGFNMSMRIKKE